MLEPSDTVNTAIISKANAFLSGAVMDCVGRTVRALQVQPTQLVQAQVELVQAQVELVQPQARKSYGESDVDKVWDTYFGSIPDTQCPLCQVNRMLRNDRSTWEMSHIVAHSEGGTSDLSNIRPLCFKCNRSMGKKHLRTYVIEHYPERYYAILKVLRIPM